MQGISRKSFKALALGSCAALALASAASAEDKAHFQIAGGDLKSALQQFARQSNQEVLFSDEVVSGKTTQGFAGDDDSRQALIKVLAGTGLTYNTTPRGTLLVVPQGGSADGGAETNVVQELVVTAQKKQENIQVVPIAISAFTQQDLTNRQVAGGPDLMTQVPNMTFTKTNFSSYSVQIRGIGTQAISATTDPAVAVAFNNTPFIRNRFFEQEFYDLERIEVLRGPQGTLYGRNATAGVVNIISAKPSFEYQAKVSADVGNFASKRLEAMANIPLVEDKVALRVAGAWTKRDGYATNQITNNPIDGRDLWSTRVSLRVTPNDAVNVNLIWEHFQEGDDRLRSGKQLCDKDVVTQVGDVAVTDYFQQTIDRGQQSYVQQNYSQGCKPESLYSPNSFQTPNGLSLPYYVPLGSIGLPTALRDPYLSQVQSNDLRVIESTIDPHYTARSDLGEFQASFDIGHGLTLQSETAYATDTVYSLQDFNRFDTAPGAWDQTTTREGVLTPGPNGGIFCDPQLGCSDRLVAVDISTASARQFSQEFRLSSNFAGPFNFSMGANFLRADSEDKYYVFINSLSMIAATAVGVSGFGPYVPGKTDNIDCMLNGYKQGDPNGVYSVVGCIYTDPNPIGSVNDEGHNYFLSKNPYKLISYAVFGEGYYNITDDLKVTGGVRWTVDKKDAPRVPTWILGSNSVGYPVAEVVQEDWSEPTGRLAIDWKPRLSFTDQTLVYGSYAHGYKAGGANPPGFVRIFYADPVTAQGAANASATRPKTFRAEFVDAFELGSKNTLLDGRMTLNLAAFYYDYKDYQISEIVDRSAFNRNFDATVWGLELEADWRPLKNLRLGFKGGYERTRIADGEKAVDLMDRTAGHDGWMVVKPFPTYASNCILPTYIYAHDGIITDVGGTTGGNPTGCEYAYLQNLDPVTLRPYVANPTEGDTFLSYYSNYPGFNPASAPNHGEGFDKDLGGNELPNAPHYTATFTGDYTIPLPYDWLATLHSDVHWQSQSWWRVFNDKAFDKLHPYFTMNLAAIFTNEKAGWTVMAYIKNVTDETAITGAFLNSDDTGLTTNVFLTEPRLYGLRVTKEFAGGPLLGGFGARREGPFPFTIELGGQIQHEDAPTGFLNPSKVAEFHAPLDIFDDAQNKALDWGDGREVKLAWRPAAGPWTLSAGVRYGKSNGHAKISAEKATDPICAFGGYYASFCETYANHPIFGKFTHFSITNAADASAEDREKHQIVDFGVGRDVGLGGFGHSSLGLGLRYAHFESTTLAGLRGVPDWNVPAGFYPGQNITHTVFDIEADAKRDFRGAGPQLSWEASHPIFQNDTWGRIDVDWSVGGGVLFGTQKTEITTEQMSRYTVHTPFEFIFAGGVVPPIPTTTVEPTVKIARSEHATSPTFQASLGLSYRVGGAGFSAGYRWERYFNVLDGGYRMHQSYDRTIDGPYVKVSVGFGG